MNADKLVVALYDGYDPAASSIPLTWAELVEMLSTAGEPRCARAGVESALPACGGRACAAKIGDGWSPVELTVPYRADENVKAVTAGVFDLDHITDEQLERVLESIKGHAFVVHSSHSHAPPTDGAYRLVIPLSRPALPAEWPRVRAEFIGLFDIPADPVVKDLSRFYFVPTARAGVPLYVHRGEGEPIDVDEALAGAPATPAPVATPTHLVNEEMLAGDHSGFSLERRAEMATQHLRTLPPSIAGQGGDAKLFDAAVAAVRGYALPSGAALEVLRGFNARCDPPWDEGRLAYKVEQAASNSTRDWGYMLFGRGLVERMAAKKVKPDGGGPLEDRAPVGTDIGNAALFAEQHANSLRFLEDRKVWLRWDGRRWLPASEKHVTGAGVRTAKKIHDSAFGMGGDAAKHAARSASAAGIAAMIRLATAADVFDANMDKLDRHPDLLNVLNGTLDLRTGELRPHDRAYLLTTLTEIEYDPMAQCPRWDQFLREVFLDDADLIAFMQRAVGYSLTGHTREQAFFVLHGGGRNGKGRFVRQLMALLGDAARTTRFQTFTVGRESSDGNTPALAALAGARLVSAGEPDAGVRFSESVIKSLTGEDEIMACAKFEAPFTFTPRFKVWLHCNHKPEIRGTDEGIWRRPRLVPFLASFEGDRADPELDAKLDAERPGILAWAVRGAAAWYAHGLGTCEAVRAATNDYRAESDVLGPFFEERIQAAPGAFVSNRELYAAYAEWCAGNGEEPLEPRQLRQRMPVRGFMRDKRGGERGWTGAALIRVAQPWQRQPAKVLSIAAEQNPAVSVQPKGQ